MDEWRRNIIITYILKVCFSLIFSISVITLFWKKYGLSLADIFLLQAIFAVSIVFFEIPTGYIGDQLGRKKTLILASIIITGGWTFYSFSVTFWQFIIAETLLGLGISFFSGTDTSLVYESLLALEDKDSFTKIQGRQISLGLGAEAVSALTGGFLAAVLPINFLMLMSSIAAGIACISCFGITEPVREAYKHPRGTLYGLYKIARYIFLRSKMVRFALPLMVACSLSTMIGVWFYQPLWIERSVPVWLFGILWAARAIPAAIGSHFAYKIEKLFGKKRIIWLLPLPALIGYLLIAFLPGWLALIPVYFMPLTRGIHFPVLSKYIHEETFSDKRATVLSVQSWLFRLAYFALGPFIGRIGQSSGLSPAFIVCAGIVLLSTSLFIPGLIKRINGECPVIKADDN
ncbi:MAG: MFS transporter [Spirochaetales bacterium]|nr:MFS transporter [Spirochaetales bacterium]